MAGSKSYVAEFETGGRACKSHDGNKFVVAIEILYMVSLLLFSTQLVGHAYEKQQQ